ncbi:MAG: PAS domain S-box protein [Planctomycetes bacterium]|nr:PAS domain S-box protein [Planctomycetota bacterium]
MDAFEVLLKKPGRRGRAWLGAAGAGALLAGFALIEVPRARSEAVAAGRADLLGGLELRRMAIDAWLADRQADAEAVATFPSAVELAGAPAPSDEVRAHFGVALTTFARALRYERIDVLGRGDRVLLHRGPTDAIDPVVVAAGRAAREARQGIVDLVRLADGRAALLSAAPILDAGGDVVGAAVLATDVRDELLPLLEARQDPTLMALVLRSDREGVTVLAASGAGPHEPAGLGWAAGVSDRVHFDPSARDAAGAPALGAAAPLVGAPWLVAVTTPSAAVDAAIRPRLLRAGAGWAGMAGAVLLLGVGLAWGQRQAADAALARSQGRLALLLEHANDAIVFLDLAGRIQETNRRAEVLYGPGLVGRHALEQRPARLREVGRADLELLVARGWNVYETLHVAADGREVPVEISARVVDLDGERGVVALIRDVSERRQALADLEEARRRLEGALAVGRMGHWRLDLASGRAAWAPELFALIGRDPALGAPTLEEALALLAPDARRRLEERLRRAVEEGVSSDDEHAVVRPDGRALHVRVVIDAVHDEAGRVVELHGLAQDVTDRHTAEEGLRKLSRAVEQSPASILITDPDGAIEYVNPRFEDVTGWRADEVLGKNPRLLKSGLTPREVYAELWATITAGGAWQGELHNVRKDGAPLLESATIAPIRDADGAITHFVAVKEDITARRAAEEELRRTREQLLQAQKMEAVGRLAGGVAHDFNNLLTVIEGYTRLAMDPLPAGDPARRKLEQVVRAAERAAGLTRQLLAFSRRLPASPRVVEPGALVRDMTGMLRRLLGERVALRVEAAPDAGEVTIDPGQLEQVVMNLAVNARDAMPDGGALTIEVAAEDLGPGDAALGRRAGRWVRLAVIDTGVGIDAATRARLFEPFFTTKPAGQGTGLGLATVHGIVEQAGGFMTVESAPGAGARFEVHLPRAAAGTGPVEDPAASSPPPPGRGETVLVAEDEPAVRELAREVLAARGYRVLACASGDEALGVLGRRRVDLLLSDVVMPGRAHGRRLVDEARALRPDLRVLFMSGYPDGHAAPGPVLQKPLAPAALARAVREALDEEATEVDEVCSPG